jgi:hypothetical protein
MLFSGIGMAVIQGLVVVIIVFTLLVPLPVNSGQKPPTATNPMSRAIASTNPPPLTSEKQPPDFKVQEAKIDAVIGQLCTSFKAKDVEGALKYFQAEERDKYRKIFSQSPDLLPEMAADLEKAQINFLSSNSNQYSRTAEYLIKSGGQDFSIVFIFIDGQWVLNTF